MSKSSRKLNKKKEKAAKVETRRRDAGLREQMKELLRLSGIRMLQVSVPQEQPKV